MSKAKKDHRSEETRERDASARAEESKALRRKLPDVRVAASGETAVGGRNSGRASEETRRNEQ